MYPKHLRPDPSAEVEREPFESAGRPSRGGAIALKHPSSRRFDAVDEGAAEDRPHASELVPANQGRDVLLRRLLAFADAFAAMLGSVSLALVAGEYPLATAFWAATAVPAWLLLAKLHGLYDRDDRVLHHLTVDELPSIGAWAATGTIALVGLLAVSPAGTPGLPAVGLLLAVVALSGAVLRAGARSLWRSMTVPAGVFVVGSGPLARALERKIDLFPDMHVRVVGELDDASLAELREAPDHALALTDELTEPEFERLVLATESIDEPLVADLVALCRRHEVKLSVVPPVRGMFGTAVRLSHVADLPLVEYNTTDVAQSTLFLKRSLDLALGVPMAIVLLPFMALIAIAIRLESQGPSLFVQQRAGLKGAPFRVFKFRTMGADAELRREEFVSLDDLEDPMYKLTRDPRVTRLGRSLRRLSLDELPQIFNVVKGDMSLVGPRPEELDVVRRYGPDALFRVSVKPGLTGPMQVYGRSDLRFDEVLAVEREYIENLSLGRDLRMLAMTGAAVVWGRGAY